MLTPQRHQAILDCLARQGGATVLELATRLGVSDDTIRRDLKALAATGAIEKTHGGALSTRVPDLDRLTREALLPDHKHAMARQALRHIRAGQILMLDAGSTLLALARLLPDIPLTVITHSLDIAHVLAERTRIRLILAGGEWDHRQRLFHGEATVRLIGEYRADLALMGACAIHPALGVTAGSAGDAAVKRAMLAASAQAVLLADRSKQGLTEPGFVAPLARFSHWHTDKQPAWDTTDTPAIILSEDRP